MAVRIETVNGNLTEFAGLVFFRELWKAMGMHREVKSLLPNPRKSKSISKRHHQKFDGLLYGFLAGADCLDDMNYLNQDIGFLEASSSNGFCSQAYGDFLRRFEQWHPRKFNELLLSMGLKARKALFPDDRQFILDIDSTIHRQYAKKMEGLGYNYNGEWGLDSIQAYDQYGLQYWMYLRKGSTFTSNSASTIIQKVFRGIPRKFLRYMRGDSGFCTHDVFRACSDYNVKFVVAGRANIYLPLAARVKNWRKAKGITFFDGRECSIGTTFYYRPHGRETLRVVILRARKKNPDLFDTDPYDYRAWFTNTDDHEFKWEQVIEFYSGRSNSENFIREMKNGFDIHHFPCQSLLANQMYGLIAAFAYNLMRIASLTYTKKQFHFSKKLRQRLIYIAALVVKKSRYLVFRINKHRRKEVEVWLTTLKTKFGYG